MQCTDYNTAVTLQAMNGQLPAVFPVPAAPGPAFLHVPPTHQQQQQQPRLDTNAKTPGGNRKRFEELDLESDSNDDIDPDGGGEDNAASVVKPPATNRELFSDKHTGNKKENPKDEIVNKSQRGLVMKKTNIMPTKDTQKSRKSVSFAAQEARKSTKVKTVNREEVAKSDRSGKLARGSDRRSLLPKTSAKANKGNDASKPKTHNDTILQSRSVKLAEKKTEAVGKTNAALQNGEGDEDARWENAIELVDMDELCEACELMAMEEHLNKPSRRQ